MSWWDRTDEGGVGVSPRGGEGARGAKEATPAGLVTLGGGLTALPPSAACRQWHQTG